ncbi:MULTISPECIES: hypothetical protein [unclassified Corynebacterium]|uniref:hypothetical protein n=1 Tax=unclassified Corynebacterium TaxID=2624378 RepID=UPI0029CA966F|nr:MULTISPECIES: hypothetical protein [unclassified Corynebacterium]WPF66694.1 hypothetical protein OLX12_02890 [Corynebacterium sp. 22KM0430]WPF69181.1 hypothetical protein OLW90_02885 [Corynebacterium sp. 21KM1197]
MDWFDGVDGGGEGTPSEPRSGWVDRVEEPDAVQQGKERKAGKMPPVNWWVVGGLCVLVVVVVGGGGVVMSLSSGSSERAGDGVSSAVAASSSVGETASVAVCDQVDARADDPQGVVVAFQQAYYSGDVAGLEALLADDSALRATNWEEVLRAVPQAQVCTTTTVMSDEAVAADVVVTDEVGRNVYLQEYHLEESKGGFKIMEISDRSKK